MTNNNDKTTLVFRRYPNRKLYALGTGHYVNLGDIVQAIKDGQDVKIVDSRTREDITKRILQAVLFRVQRDQLFYKDTQEIHQMIRDGLALQG